MEEKIIALSQVIQMAKIDGKLHEEEVKFIHNLGRQMGLSNERITHTFKHPVPFEPIHNEMDRIVQFQRLVLMAFVDGELSKDELSTIQSLGIQMGLNPKATDEILAKMPNYPNNLIPAEEVIAIYKKHHN